MRSRARAVVAGAVLAVLAAVVATGAPPAAAQVDPNVTGRLSLFKRIENLDTGASEGRRELWTMTAVNTEDATYTFSGNGLNGVQSTVVPAGDYTISESDGVPGYAFVSWDCGAAGTFTSPTPTITVPPDGDVTCTVRNDAQKPSLTLQKVSSGPANANAWTLVAQGPTSFSGTTGVRQAVAIGQYQLSETNGPPGYTASDWVCTGGNQVSGSSVVITLGQDVVCTITNTREVSSPHLLTLQKVVDGGPAAASDYQLSATGPDTVSGPAGSASVTQVPVASGTYALAEAPLFPVAEAGYTAGPWTCTGGTLTGSTLTLTDADGDATCSVTNTFSGGRLTLVKQVVGGTIVPQAWTLSATSTDGIVRSGPSGSPGVTGILVPAGVWTLAESGPANYAASPWVCTSGGLTDTTVQVAPGDDITCTVTNTIEDASLTLVKQVDNTGGGTAAPTDFLLRAVGGDGTVMVGTSGSAAVTHVEIETGQTWSLGEDAAPGYTAGPWTCTGATAVDDAVTIDETADVVCTVTNTWTGGFLTLVKQVEGSSTPPAAWTLTADGPVVVSGATGTATVTRVPVPAGDYTLDEEQIAGFTASGWDCGAAPLVGTVVTVATGADVTCTVTNTATQPHLTLTKLVDSSAGGTLDATAWQLSAVGPQALSGVSGSAAVTLVAVEPGAYALSESPAVTPDYTASDWICVSGATVVPVTAGSVTIPETSPDGSAFTGDVRCTIINTADAPHLSLVKVLDNRGGGVATVDAFVLLGIGPDVLVGASRSAPVTDVPVHTGTYSLLEIGVPNYTSDGWACVDAAGANVPVVDGGVTLDLGDDVTCTVTNRWVGARLTLAKAVDGGPAVPADWRMVAATPTGGFSGVAGSPDATGLLSVPGDVTLHEVPGSAVAELGYELDGWVCDDDHPVTDGNHTTLVANDEVTCTATNRWIGSTLTLAKVVEGGGPAAATDWTLSALGPTGALSGATGDAAVTAASVVPGTYTLAETGAPQGYRSDGWACDGATVLGDVLVVDGGEDVTCTVTNVYDPAVPPITPPVTPPGGGSATGAAGGGTLATTGSDALPVGLLAAALLALGAAAAVVARRRA